MKQKVPKGRDAKPNAPFLSTIEEIRRRARQHMESGSVTEAYGCRMSTSWCAF